MNTGQRADGDLTGVRVLVVEDDYFIASESAPRCVGAAQRSSGRRPTCKEGSRCCNASRFDCAVLDINLHGEMVFRLAHELTQRGIPSIFATGYDESVVQPDLAGLVCLEKPINLGRLLRTIGAACSTRGETVSDL